MKKGTFRTELEAVYPRLWRFSIALTGRYDQGQDLAQSTAVRALEHASSYTLGTRIDHWLFTMARRIWLNEIRAEGVRRGHGTAPVETLDLPDTAPDQVANIFSGEVLSKVMALPDGQRMAVLMVYVEGNSYAQAAEMLDIPIGTVMSRLSSARKRLSAELAIAKDTAL